MTSEEQEIPEGAIINAKWRCEKKLGSGSQGVVYSAIDITSGQKVAIKTGPVGPGQMHLKKEHDIYTSIKQNNRSSNLAGIPDAHYYHQSGGSAMLVMDLLGPSLLHLFLYQGNVFSKKTFFMLFKHMLIAIENLHESGFIHRDIKPDNICMGRGENAGVVHLIDLGVAIQYKDEVTGQHFPMEEYIAFNGTVKYASLNSLSGKTCSRRDDLESLIYVMMYFFNNELPFGKVDRNNLDKAMYESRIQKARDIDKICEGYPNLLKDILSYVRNLDYDERPDYLMMRDLVEADFARLGFHEDGYFDWFYTKTGEEIENSPENLDLLYEKIFSMMRTESEPSENESQVDKNTVKSDQLCSSSTERRERIQKNMSDQSVPTGKCDELSSASNRQGKSTLDRGGFFKRIASFKKSSHVSELSRTENRHHEKSGKNGNGGTSGNQEEKSRKEGIFRRIFKRRGI